MKKHFDDLTKLGNNVALEAKKGDECVDLIMVKFLLVIRLLNCVH